MNNYINKIIDEFYNISDRELMELAQSYLDYNLWEEKIGYMRDLDDACDGMAASEIISNLDKNFDIFDSFIYIDNIGCIYSANDLSLLVDSKIGFEMMAKDIIEAGSCNIASIQDILNEIEKEEEGL